MINFSRSGRLVTLYSGVLGRDCSNYSCGSRVGFVIALYTVVHIVVFQFFMNENDQHSVPTNCVGGGKFIKAANINAQSARNKSAVLTDLIVSRDLDLLAMTEVWHESSEDVAIRRIVLSGYRSLDSARTTKNADGSTRGGGVALIFEKTSRLERSNSIFSQQHSNCWVST